MLYGGSEWERHNAQGATVGQMWKLNPAAPDAPLVWSQKDDGEDKAGVFSTPGLVGDLAIYTTYSGRAIGVDRTTGAIRWEKRLTAPLMGSPVDRRRAAGSRVTATACSTRTTSSNTAIDPPEVWQVGARELHRVDAGGLEGPDLRRHAGRLRPRHRRRLTAERSAGQRPCSGRIPGGCHTPVRPSRHGDRARDHRRDRARRGARRGVALLVRTAGWDGPRSSTEDACVGWPTSSAAVDRGAARRGRCRAAVAAGRRERRGRARRRARARRAGPRAASARSSTQRARRASTASSSRSRRSMRELEARPRAHVRRADASSSRCRATASRRSLQTTQSLREALSSTKARGQWGERMAEDVLRLAGLRRERQLPQAEGDRTRPRHPRLHVPAPQRPVAPHGREVPARQLPALLRVRRPTSSASATATTSSATCARASRRSALASTSIRAAAPSTSCCCSSRTSSCYAFIHEQDGAILDDARAPDASCSARRSRCSPSSR